MSNSKVAKAIAPSAGRLVAKIILSCLIAAGVIDDATVIGFIDDPVVIALGVGLVNMIRHEVAYRRQYGVSQDLR